MISQMTAILYPVAANAEQALSRPLGRAARQREAGGVAGEAVVFTTDAVGPAFATAEAAQAAYGGPLAELYGRLVAQVVGEAGVRTAPVEPTFENGRRWPAPCAEPPRTAWRLMVSYWRVATAERPLEAPQARQARRARRTLDPEALRAIARQPLRPVEPQQPLDIGLFETRLPESPQTVIPDE